MDKNKLLSKVGLLCIKLTSDYRRETLWKLTRIIEQTGEPSRDIALKKKELESNFDIGSFIVTATIESTLKLCKFLMKMNTRSMPLLDLRTEWYINQGMITLQIENLVGILIYAYECVIGEDSTLIKILNERQWDDLINNLNYMTPS